MARFFTKENAWRLVKLAVALILVNLLAQACYAGVSATTAKASTVTKAKSPSCKVSVPQLKLKLVEESWVDTGQMQSEFQGAVVFPKGTSYLDLNAVGYGKTASTVVKIVPVDGGQDVTKTVTFKRPAKSLCAVSALSLKKITVAKCEKRYAQYIFTVTPIKKTRLEQKTSFKVTLLHKGKTVTKKLSLYYKDEVDNTRVFGIEVAPGDKLKTASVTYFHKKGLQPKLKYYSGCLGD